MMTNQEILLGVIVIMVLYLIYNKTNEYIIGQNAISSRIQTEAYLVREMYENSVNQKKNMMMKPKQKFVVAGNGSEDYVTTGKQEAFEERYVQDNRSMEAMCGVADNGSQYPTVEEYGSNPYNALGTADFSQSMMEGLNGSPKPKLKQSAIQIQNNPFIQGH